MSQRGDLKELPKERIFDELKKLLLKSKKPSIGFELLREFGALKYFPELKSLIGVQQEKKWHPEGDVWVHTMMSLDEMSKLLTGDAKKDLILMLGILCHDFGKPETTQLIDGKIRSLGHEAAGVEPTKIFLSRLTDEVKLIESVLPLVKYHLSPSQFFSQKSSDKAIRRLSTKVNIEDLELVARADFFGRDLDEAKSGKFAAGDWLLDRASKLCVKKEPLKKLLFGRDLISLG
jgi:tRNA nucleotidyltransferase (CCA-adding enzyme)